MKLKDWMPPRSHTDDPDTSRAAEAEMKRSGKMDAHMRAVLALVEAHPGSTGSGLANQACFDERFDRDPHKRLYQVRRRLSDLRLEGKIIRGPAHNGEREVRWWPTGHPGCAQPPRKPTWKQRALAAEEALDFLMRLHRAEKYGRTAGQEVLAEQRRPADPRQLEFKFDGLSRP